MSFPVRIYYDPFSEFDRLFDEAFAARGRPSSAVAERAQNNDCQLFRPKYVLESCLLTFIYLACHLQNGPS